MPDAFVLRWKLDRPCVEAEKPEDVYALLAIEPNPTVLADRPAVPLHLLLLVDVSGSMDFLARHDPTAPTVGQKITDGQIAQKVISNVPSRREIACAVVQKLAERLGPDDRMSLVAFDERVHVLARALSPSDMDGLSRAVRGLQNVGGGGTALAPGLRAIREILTNINDAPRSRKLILLTDGEDEEPAQALAQARSLGNDCHVPIVAFGMGECKVAFLTELAKTTLAGAFNHIREENDAERLFSQVLAGQKNVQATNVNLKLWLAPDVQVSEFYRTRPEVLFIGAVQPDADNVATLNLEQLERGKASEFLLRCTLPRRGSGQRLRIAKAALTFDLPSLGLTQQTLESNVIVEFSADPQRLAERSGDVRRVLAHAHVQRQLLFLQAKIDALKFGRASDRDKIIVANLLKALIAKFAELGDIAMANHYQAMEEEFVRNGVISQEMLNRSLAASSRAEEVAMPVDIDF